MTDNTQCACPCHSGKTITHIRPCCEPAWPQNVAGIYGTPTTQPTDNTGLIEQCDRDAAADYWRRSKIGTNSTYRGYVEGVYDESNLVQAFARHRIEVTRTPPGESGLREALILAAKRLARLALDHGIGSEEFLEISEWGEEARKVALSSPTDRT